MRVAKEGLCGGDEGGYGGATADPPVSLHQAGQMLSRPEKEVRSCVDSLSGWRSRPLGSLPPLCQRSPMRSRRGLSSRSDGAARLSVLCKLVICLTQPLSRQPSSPVVAVHAAVVLISDPARSGELGARPD